VVALALAWREWRGRPRPGHPTGLPPWMSAIGSMTPVRATGLGALLAAVNPKNLTLCLAAGASIGGAGLNGGEDAVVVAVFVVVASSTVAVPVIGYVAAGDRATRPLDDLRDWLTDNNATVMTVLLLVIGAVILGQGVAGL
jgi:threonine/homoserine/homoserine lactone efflux protein